MWASLIRFCPLDFTVSSSEVVQLFLRAYFHELILMRLVLLSHAVKLHGLDSTLCIGQRVSYDPHFVCVVLVSLVKH
jgi:hypothetical protein